MLLAFMLYYFMNAAAAFAYAHTRTTGIGHSNHILVAIFIAVVPLLYSAFFAKQRSIEVSLLVGH